MIDCRTHPKDLLAQKRSSPSRLLTLACIGNLSSKAKTVNEAWLPERRGETPERGQMDFGIIAGVLLVVVWAVVALVMNGPGWIHLLLTVAVSLIIWRIVVRGDRRHPEPRA